MPGDAVSFFDTWRQERKTGTVIEVRRSSKNPWLLAVVRLVDGTDAEVHPDRLERIGMTAEELAWRTAGVLEDHRPSRGE
jgi:hypothetical protein